VGLKLNGTNQLPVYANDVNLLGDNIDTIKKNTETSIDAGMEAALEENAEKTMYMLLYHQDHQRAGQNHNIKIANKSSENVAQFRYLGMTITNQNLIQEEFKRRLILGTACHQSRIFCLPLCCLKT
jgi:hypothetical protein